MLTTRSNVSGSNSYSAASPVITFRLENPFELATVLMYSFCVRELENAVICELGKRSAKKRDAEPQPQLWIVSSCVFRGQVVPSVRGQRTGVSRDYPCRLPT